MKTSGIHHPKHSDKPLKNLHSLNNENMIPFRNDGAPAQS